MTGCLPGQRLARGDRHESRGTILVAKSEVMDARIERARRRLSPSHSIRSKLDPLQTSLDALKINFGRSIGIRPSRKPSRASKPRSEGLGGRWQTRAGHTLPPRRPIPSPSPRGPRPGPPGRNDVESTTSRPPRVRPKVGGDIHEGVKRPAGRRRRSRPAAASIRSRT